MPFVTAALAALPVVAAIPPGNHTFFSIAIAILGIGCLIFVHELGHFLACRLTGTRVETFSIGFGPRLFGWERVGKSGRRTFTVGPRKIRADQDGFDWRISAIPLGGYVKMAGEVGGDGTPTDGLGIVRPPQPDEFPQKPFAARAFIISAGVIMNAIAAVTLYSIAYGSGLEETPPIAGAVSPGGAAWAAGIRAGDRFETYDGEPVRSFEEFANEVVFTKKGAPVQVVLDRRGTKTHVALSPKYEADVGLQRAGVEHPFEWTIDDGKGPKVVIAPNEPVLVSGRFAGGAAAALRLARVAQALGVESVRLEFPSRKDAPAREVALPIPKPDWKSEGPPMLGVALHERTLTVETVFPGGAAEKAGIRAKDRLLAADGVTLDSDRMLQWLRRLGSLDVERAGARLTLTPAIEDPEVMRAVLDDLVFEKAEGVLVTPDGGAFPDGKSPAAGAGVRPWDQILEVGATKITKSEDVLAALKGQPAGKVSVKVKTAGEEPRVVEVLPKQRADVTGHEGPFGDAAVAVPRETITAAGPLDALRMGANRSVVDVKNMFRMIGRFFGGEINPGKTLGGPGTIVNISSRSANEGLARFLAFLAFISVNLAVLNILPIPVLDGGSLLLQIIVALRRGKPLKEATVAYVQWAGFALLMLLMVFALKNDVVNLTN